MSDQNDERQGRQGDAGPAGRQGEAGVPGSEGRPGRSGEPGHRGERGPRAPMRWGPAIGYIILALLFLGTAWFLLHTVAQNRALIDRNKQLIDQVKHDCVDRAGDIASRKQWKRVAFIIEHTDPEAKPGSPGYIKPQDASRQFAESYKQALREAGPVPPCIGTDPR